MAPPSQEVVETAEDASDADSDIGAGLLWVPKKLLEEVTGALEKKEPVSLETVKQLVEADDIPDDAVLVPVDTSDAADAEDVENIIETLGAEKVAQIFVNG